MPQRINELRQKSFDRLITQVLTGLAMKISASPVKQPALEEGRALIQALQAGRYEFATEIWHDAHERDGTQIYPAEMLLRATRENGERIKPLAPITAIAQAGLQPALDQALILAGITQALARGQMPVSINTSARNIASTAFWEDVSDMLRTHFTSDEIHGQLTFEVTEDDLADNPCREILLGMKKEFACTFAIDDFYHDRAAHAQNNTGIDSLDWARLNNLKEIVDFVKIDGETVETAVAKNFDLHDLITRIKQVTPHVHIVLERVKDADEAYLFSHMSDAVQGHKLTNDRDAFKQELKDAACNFPPRPKNRTPDA